MIFHKNKAGTNTILQDNVIRLSIIQKRGDIRWEDMKWILYSYTYTGISCGWMCGYMSVAGQIKAVKIQYNQNVAE